MKTEPAATVFRRGDILWIDCDPSVGAEPKMTRTCVVVSNDIANQWGATVTVVPTQKFSAERGSRSYMVDLRAPRSTLRESRVANASMIMTCDKARVVKKAGHLHSEAVDALNKALALHLGLVEI